MDVKHLLHLTAAALLSFQTISKAADAAASAAPSAPEGSPAASATPEPPVVRGTPATPPTDKSEFKIFLLIGQSNMAGRAALVPEDKQADPHVIVLNRLDQWYSQGDPIHYDKPGSAGVGPGLPFARLLAAKQPGVTVGLVPCAFGGTSIQEWDPAAKKLYYPPCNLYDNAIRRAKIAMKSGTLAGILWHQGEGNANETATTYAAALAKLVTQIRKDLDAPDVPFIAGEIGTFLYERKAAALTINQQIESLPTLLPKSGVASSEGLKDKGDRLHFDNASQKELAKRYLDAYLKLETAGAVAH